MQAQSLAGMEPLRGFRYSKAFVCRNTVLLLVWSKQVVGKDTSWQAAAVLCMVGNSDYGNKDRESKQLQETLLVKSGLLVTWLISVRFWMIKGIHHDSSICFASASGWILLVPFAEIGSMQRRESVVWRNGGSDEYTSRYIDFFLVLIRP